jgi:REP element-mobilizing transposase RayT
MRHGSRDEFRRPLPAHVTLRLRDDTPSLRDARVVAALERTFAAGCTRPGFRLVHYSLQGNHAHLIVEAQDRHTLGRGMMAIGARLARAVNRVAARTGRVLADRYHVRMLGTPKEVRNALRYVLLNARHHAARAAATAKAMAAGIVRLDPASSARWFDGWKRGQAGIGCASNSPPLAAPPPVARARTWLLAVGWRRHGLLDPADVPG